MVLGGGGPYTSYIVIICINYHFDLLFVYILFVLLMLYSCLFCHVVLIFIILIYFWFLTHWGSFHWYHHKSVASQCKVATLGRILCISIINICFTFIRILFPINILHFVSIILRWSISTFEFVFKLILANRSQTNIKLIL